jgi:hypothetical protein
MGSDPILQDLAAIGGDSTRAEARAGLLYHSFPRDTARLRRRGGASSRRHDTKNKTESACANMQDIPASTAQVTH